MLLARFLRDSDLSVLEGHEMVSREDDARYAEEQYTLFAARRQEQGDDTTATNYAADLEPTVNPLESKAKRKSAKGTGDKPNAAAPQR